MNFKVVAGCPSKVSNYVVSSDASATGCSAHLDVNGEQVCHKKWGKDECGKSSTWRELSAILFALQSFLPPLLKGSYVKWFSDRQNACNIIQVESMRSDLHAIALEIFQFCNDYGIELEVQWIPRTEIDRADYISRIIDVDDWQISASCFMSLETSWGAHTVDCFASFYCHSSRTVLAFFSFLAHYFSEICQLHVDYKYFHANSLEHGRNTNSLLGRSRFGGFVFALRMVFS